MDFHWSLSDSKSPQVSRTLLSILAVLNNVVVWMVSTRPPTFKSSSPFSNPLVTIPKEPITIGIINTCMFHSFFQFPSKFEVLILLFTFFHPGVVATEKGAFGLPSTTVANFTLLTWGSWFLSCELVNLLPNPVYFLSTWFSGIIAIINSTSKNASLWMIPLWIFTSAKVFPPASYYYYYYWKGILT